MKKYILLFSLFFSGQALFSQYSLLFCEDVTADGRPIMVSNQFMVDDEGGALKFLIRTDNKFSAGNLDFRIYFIGDNGTEEEIVRLPQTVEPDWGFAWKEIVMYDPGIYRVKIYTEKGAYLTSANLTLKRR